MAWAAMLGIAPMCFAQTSCPTPDPNAPKAPEAAHLPKGLDLKAFPLLEDLQYPAAVHKAKKNSRILLIFWCKDPPSEPRWTFEACASSITLRAYIKWHAVAIWMRELPPGLALEVCRRGAISPAVLIVRDGELEHVVCPGPPTIGGPAVPRGPCDPVGNKGNPDDRMVPHPVRVLYGTDFAMDRIAARDAVWMETHNLANPKPQPPPEPEPANMVRDEYAPVVYDPRPEERIGALDRLDEARRLVKECDYYRATGVYTWLWERAAAMDPAFRPAQLSALAQDIDALAAKHPDTLERFIKIRDGRNERLPWAEFGQMHDWFVLNGVTRNAPETLEYFDYFINDPDEGAMIPPDDMMAYKLLARRENFVQAWERPSDPVARIKTIADRLDPKFPPQVREKERAEYRAFARQYLLDEGARIYTACLVKGDEVVAQQVAEAVLKARNDEMARLSLITTALAADPPQARAIHERWLREAEASTGASRPDLHNRLTLGVREPAETKR